MFVSGDPTFPFRRFCNRQTAASGIVRRVTALDRVEAGGLAVEANGIGFSKQSSFLPKRTGHQYAGHGVASAGTQCALIKWRAMAVVGHAFRPRCKPFYSKVFAAFVVLNVSSQSVTFGDYPN